MPSITFTITVIDPCLTTVIDPFVINNITQEAGVSVDTVFNEPDDSAGTAVGDQSICGPKTYSVVYRADDSAQTLITIETISANTQHKLVSYTDLESDEGTHELKLVVSLADSTYPTLVVDFDLTISPATCDCKLLNWIYPTNQSIITTVKKEVPDTLTILHATVDSSSYDTTPAIRACYRTDLGTPPGCDETTAITQVIEEGSTLPSYFTLSGNVLTIDATDNSQVRVYTMEVTHDTQFEDAPIVFNTVSIDLRVCVITDIDPPTAPTSTEQLIFATSPLNIDISSPGFVQRPACGYTLTETFTWEIPSDAPITETGDYTIQVSSNDAADRNVYTVKLIDSANYPGTGVTYSNEISFDVTVTDPCLTTTLSSLTVPNVAVEAGLTDTFTFAEITDSAADAVSSPTICGERTYTVYELDSSNVEQA